MELKYIKRILKNPHSFIRSMNFQSQLIWDILGNSKDQYEKMVYEVIKKSPINVSFRRGGYQARWAKGEKLVYSNKSVIVCCYHMSKQEYKIVLVYFDRNILSYFYKKLMMHHDSSLNLKQKFYQSNLKNYCKFIDSSILVHYTISMESYLSSKAISPKLIKSLENNWDFWDYIASEYKKEIELKLGLRK